MEEIKALLGEAVQKLFGEQADVVLTRPEEQFGDYATNVALQLAKKVGKNPREVAESIAAELKHESIAKTEVAGPGFINITLSDKALTGLMGYKQTRLYAGQVWTIEYSCPNYFKELHAGHLYQTIYGDVIARLVELSGAKVHRTNFGGDVGLHVAKAMYGMVKLINGEYSPEIHASTVDAMKDMREVERPGFLSSSYVLGSTEYEKDQDGAKRKIEELNAELYLTVFSENSDDFDDEGSAAQREMFSIGRSWSREYFDLFYGMLDLKKQEDGSFFDYIPESDTAQLGKEIVQGSHIGQSISSVNEPNIFTKSEGAIVFKGEEYGLHTRVFLTKNNLPTYEAKDLGLIAIESKRYRFDKRVLITGSDQKEYMKVVWKVADLLMPGIQSKMTHMTNGIIKFGDGKKMSSRLGNVTRAVDVLESVSSALSLSSHASIDTTVLGAVKYEFLKYRLGGDIAFNPQESVSLEGNSGPYLQYAHARACSILRKSSEVVVKGDSFDLDAGERTLVRKLGMFTEAVDLATGELMPHYICTYLYELAKEFNRFYEENRVMGDPREAERLGLVSQYAETLKSGLTLLGIHAPEQM